MLVLKLVLFISFVPCFLSLLLCLKPELLRNYSFVNSVINRKVGLAYYVVFFVLTCNLFGFSSLKSYFSAIYGIVKNFLNKRRNIIIQRIILTLFLLKPVIIKIFCNSVNAYGRIYKLIKYYTDNLNLIFSNFKFSVNELITIWCKTAIPFAFTCLLLSAFHSLNTDIFSFKLSNCRKNLNYQFTCAVRTVKSIFGTDKVNSVILKLLQRGKDIGGISAKA